MNVLWMSWKDINHPQAGGAEAVSTKLRQNLAKHGHKVKLITSGYPGSKDHDDELGVEIYRTGGRFSVYYKAYKLFRKDFRDWPDIIIDEMNTIPFGCAFYSRRPSVLLTYQLARKVWFYQLIFPFSLIGYVLEPVYLFLLSKKYKLTLTESKSSQKDLTRFGFKENSIKVFRVGIDLMPIDKSVEKQTGLCLSIGSIRPMKQTLSAVKAFEFARDENSKLRLIIAGDNTGSYAKKVMAYIHNSRHKEAIEVLGRVNNKEKLILMRKASVILVTSIKEGWGLIVTEANSQGTPAIVYDTDGLRDSVVRDKTGYITAYGKPKLMGQTIVKMLSDRQKYAELAKNALEYSRQFTYDNSYSDFVNALKIVNPKINS